MNSRAPSALPTRERIATLDVLRGLALMGFVPLFGLRRVSDQGLVMIVAGCIVCPLLASLLRVAFVSKDFTASRVALGKGFAASNDAAFGAGNFLATVVENLRLMAHEYGNLYSLWGTFGWYGSMTLTMLLGVLAGRRLWARRIPELMPQIKRLTWIMLVVGLTLSTTATLMWEANRAIGPSSIKTFAGLCFNVSRPMVMVFYVLLIVQLFHCPAWRPLFKPFELAGRMPLTRTGVRQNTEMKANASGIRHQPAYGPAEAARYLRLPAATLRTWLVGRRYPKGDAQTSFHPLIKPAGGKRLAVAS